MTTHNLQVNPENDSFHKNPGKEAFARELPEAKEEARVGFRVLGFGGLGFCGFGFLGFRV